MDHPYKKSIIAMGIIEFVELILFILVNLFQDELFDMFGRPFGEFFSTMYRREFYDSGEKVFLVYLCICMIFWLIMLIILAYVTGSQKYKASPKAGGWLFGIYGIGLGLLMIYYFLSGMDRIWFPAGSYFRLQTLSLIGSAVMTPLSTANVAIFVVTAIRFIVSAKKAQSAAS